MFGQYYKNHKAKNSLVFIHGWCCHPNHFKKQVDAFKSKFNIYCANYSEIVKTRADCEDDIFIYCVNKIQEEITQLGLNNIFFVGHSMGGNIALILANTIERTALGSVIIDTTMLISSEAMEKLQAFFLTLDEKDLVNQERMVREFIENKWSKEYDSKHLMSTIVDGMILTWRACPNQFNNLFCDALKFDSRAAIENSSGPLMYLAATPSACDLTELSKIKNTIDTQEILSGHFVMLNQYRKTNELLTTFLNNPL